MNIQDYTDKVYLKDGLFFSVDKREISYPSEGNQNCFQIEEDSFWFNHRNNCIVEAVKKFSPNDVFFDIGGGNGFVAKGLEGANIQTVLVEPGINGALNARKRGLTHIVCSTLEDAGFKHKTIKSIGLFDVVEHINDDHQFLKSINSYLASGGTVYITVPAFNFLWSNEDVHAGHFRRYTLKKLSALLKETGFQVAFSTYIFSILPAPIFFLRTIPSLLGFSKNSDDLEKHKSEHAKKKGIINSLVQKIWAKELSCIKNERKIPFGGSCFIVAKKSPASDVSNERYEKTYAQ
jgi:hypothetical protein